MLRQNTFCPISQRRFVKIQARSSGKNDHLCLRMTLGDATQLLREVFETRFAPQEDDLRLLQSHLREEVADPGALGHHNDIVTSPEGLSHTGQQNWIVVSDGDMNAAFPPTGVEHS